MLERDKGVESVQRSHGRGLGGPLAARASACGKAIIIGEHAVVYGSRAIAIPLEDLRMAVELKPTPTFDGSTGIQLKLGGKAVSSHLRGVVSDAFKLLRVEPFALSVDGHSHLPIGAGLGSSATLCVAILRALAGSLGRSIEPNELARFANILEARFHGNPSGLDTAVVAHEAPIVFARGAPARPLKIAPPRSADHWSFALIDSGVRASTLAMVHLASPYFAGAVGERRVARFDTLAQALMDGLGSGDLVTVAAAMDESSEYLAAAGVVTDDLRSIMSAARDRGVLAAKPTGAGGGGVILALLDPGQPAAQLEALREYFGPNRVLKTNLGAQLGTDSLPVEEFYQS